MYGRTIKILDLRGRESQKKGKQSTQINFCQTQSISWLTYFNGALVIMGGKLEFSKGWVLIFWQKTNYIIQHSLTISGLLTAAGVKVLFS